MTVEMMAPVFVHESAPIPNRLIGLGAGLAVGLACAILLGLWRQLAARQELRNT
jgi:hypothetical protein